MARNIVSIILCSLLGVSLGESAFIDYLRENRCSVEDNACQKKLYTNAIQAIAKTGLPENNIPAFDPYVIKNVSIPVLNLVDIGMVEGVAKGIKNCAFGKINTTIENYHSTMEILCDEIVIKGHYKAIADNPLVKNLLGGGAVRGDGKAKVVIEKFRVLFDFDIFLRETNNEIFIDCTYDDTHYKVDFGKMTISADNLYIGNLELSNQIISIFNANWRFFVDTFGKPFIDTAMDFAFVYTHRFFDVTPASTYLLEDLREWYKPDRVKTDRFKNFPGDLNNY